MNLPRPAASAASARAPAALRARCLPSRIGCAASTPLPCLPSHASPYSGVVPMAGTQPCVTRLGCSTRLHPRRIARLPLKLQAADSDSDAESAQPPAPLDLPKVISLGVMFLCSCFNYTILQNLKDSLIVTSAGAEVLPFLGSYGVLPGSILFYIYHGKIIKALPEKYVYYAALLPFLAFYVLFATVLYPLAPVLHPTHLLVSWQAMLPGGLVGLASMGVYWLFSLFFVVAELWGGVAISLLFWGLADDVCSMQEAKDVYPALGMIANVGLIAAGAWTKFINKLAGGSDVLSLRLLTATIVVVSGVLLATKSWVDAKYMVDAHADAAVEADKRRKKKKKNKGADEGGGLSTAFNVLKKSPKVGNLAVLVTSYFVVQKLFDFAWKAQLRLFYPTTTGYQAALADVAQMTGVATIALMATSKFAFEHLGWKGTALISPVAIGVTGTVFFAAALGAQNPAFLGPTMAALIIPLGAAAGLWGRVISKSAKYSLFDPAKEMVYISMDKQEKTEGKAAVDLLASYFGKSGASLLTQALVLVFGTLNRSMPLIAASHFLVCIAWTKSTLSLAKLMKSSESAYADTLSLSTASASSASLASMDGEVFNSDPRNLEPRNNIVPSAAPSSAPSPPDIKPQPAV